MIQSAKSFITTNQGPNFSVSVGKETAGYDTMSVTAGTLSLGSI